MWMAQGFFDQDPAQATQTKSRLLKPGSTVAIGRKNQPLIINSKKISSEHCVLKVGDFSLEDVRDPEKRPSLQVFNSRDKTMLIRRNGRSITLNGKATIDLQPGDELGLSHSIMILVVWQLTCYMPHPSPSIIASCAALGINVVQIPHPSVDYHITTSYTSTTEVGISLLSRCNLVNPNWLETVIELCNNADITDYVPLPLSKYRPAFSLSLRPQHKNFHVWEPMQMRKDLFRDHRFLCVAEKERDIDSSLREFIARGSGAVEIFCASGGIPKWREALKRGTAKDATLVLVADSETMLAVAGESGWRGMCEEASRYHKRFFSTADLVEVVLNVDTTIFKDPPKDMSQDRAEVGNYVSSPLPDCVPNSIPEEMTVPPTRSEEERPASQGCVPSQLYQDPDSQPHNSLNRWRTSSQEPSSQLEDDPPPAPRKHLTRRGPPLEVPSSQPAVTQPEDDPPELPRKHLTRRVKAGVPVLSGLGDSSAIINAAVAASDPSNSNSSVPAEPMILDLTAPVALPSSKLKRRFGTNIAQSSSMPVSEPSAEPALKKFKALFEATNDPEQADVLMSQLPVNDIAPIQTQSPPATSVDTRKTDTTTGQTLDPIAEGIQESQMTDPGAPTAKGKKRKATTDDEEMMDIEAGLTLRVSKFRASSLKPPSKKLAVENINAIESSSQRPPSHRKTGQALGALPGKPDTDPVFLKAVASTKRGKKTEDDFDREFNKLKISKPEKENPEEQWAILDDFSNDRNIRGNFMVIVEMDVYKDCFPNKRHVASNPEWDNQPNFKRFKRRNFRPQSKNIELVVSENPDYLAGENLSPQTQSTALDDLSQNFTQRVRTHNRPFLVDDSDEEMPARSRKQNSRAGSKKTVTNPASKSFVKSQPLFLDDDTDDDPKPRYSLDIENPDEDLFDQTLPSANSAKRSARRTVAKGRISVDDDEDEDAFKGFKVRRR